MGMMAIYFISGIFIGAIVGAVVMYAVRPKHVDVAPELNYLKKQIADLRNENAALIARAAAADERAKTLSDVRGDMMRDFKNVSAELLSQTRKDATAEHTKNLNITINPFREQIEKLTTDFNKQIKDVLKDSVKNRTSIEGQIKNMMDASSSLRQEANDLTTALRGNKKIQGNWGEIQIARLFEILGWQPGVQYDAQMHLNDNKDIPDYIVHMPGDKHFVVDAKVSLNSYMDYIAAETPMEKQQHWRAFVDATKQHIVELGKKDYSGLVDCKFDYVCMFMPLEHAYLELMNGDRDDLYKFAYDNGVTIATPSLLIPMLRTIDTLMKVEKQSKNVERIVEYATKLLKKYIGFTEDYKKIGNALKTLQTTYDDGRGKLVDGPGSISSWMEKLKKQGALPVNKQIALPPENVYNDEDVDENDDE